MKRFWRFFYWPALPALLALCIAHSCTKVVDVAPLRLPENGGDTTRDVRKMLDSVPRFSLFAYACDKTGILTTLQPNTLYTLFVPTDSAMESAGLTKTAMDQFPPDSLSKIVQYLITYGALSDTALNSALVSVQQNCLLQTTLFSPQGTASPGYSTYRHSLYVKMYSGLLNINGWVVDAGQASVKATNGYLYTINQVLPAPAMKISDIVFGRPEFSYYAAAIETLDSVYRTLSYNGADQPYEDTVLFSHLAVEEASIYFSGGYGPYSRYPTVFAPTNTAFANAGFASEAAVKQWVVSRVRVDTLWFGCCYYQTNPIPGNGLKVINGIPTYGYFNFATIDSVMKTHYLLSATEVNGEPFAALLCYSDLTQCASINSGVLNQSSLPPNGNGSTASISPFNLQYRLAANGVLDIQWNPAGTNNALVPQDPNQAVQQRTFWTMNGVVYATDQLFYQP